MTLTRLPLLSLAVLSVLVAVGSWRFVFMGLDAAFEGPVFEDFLQNSRAFLWAHVIASPIALAIGAFQFFPKFRNKSFLRHRWIGWVYVLSILVGGLSAIMLTFASVDTRPVAAVGFFLLGVVWLGTTGYAIHHARHGNIVAHRAWMIRSFAMTASAVTLRIYLAIFMGFGLDYEEVSAILAWICWVPNLIFAEWLLAREKPRTNQDLRPAE